MKQSEIYDDEWNAQEYYEKLFENLKQENFERTVADEYSSLNLRKKGIIKRTKELYQESIDDISQYYEDNVNLQKKYYSNADSHWLTRQQEYRNKIYFKKFIMVLLFMIILSLFIYLLTI